MNKTILSASNLCHHFDNTSTPLFHNFCLDIQAGEKVALIGRSGSGKTTLLHLLSGLQRAQAGTISIRDKVLNALDDYQQANLRNHTIGFVYQTFNLMQDFTAVENIAIVPRISGNTHQESLAKANIVMKNMAIDHLANRSPNSLSGGEKQRVAIARAIINQPALLFADEPTGNLDHDSAKTVMHCLDQCYRDSNMTLVIATHDHELAQSFDRVIDLNSAHAAI